MEVIEALSRGASFAFFVDYSVDAKQILVRNISRAGYSSKSRIECMRVRDFITTQNSKFDILFIDQPFPSNNPPALYTTRKLLHPNSIIVYRKKTSMALPATGNGLQILDRHTDNGYEIIFFSTKD